MSEDSETLNTPAADESEKVEPDPGYAPTQETPALVQRVGKYALQRKLGSGGMGTVYLALDTLLKRTVALKVLPKESARNPTLVKRFESEAQSAAQLRHDNIVAVYDFGTADGYLFIALEFVDGKDVHEMLVARGTLEVTRSVEIVRQTAVALQHAYETGIVHRDIKPSNIMVDGRGIVKLADMGLARSVDETVETGITRAGTTVGTVDYMAPEQARDSKAADIRSDIYSLGCTLYHMLTGRVPFPKGSLTNKLIAHATRERPDPRTLNPRVPDAVAEVVLHMMERSPKKRFQTPGEVVAALEALGPIDLDEEIAGSFVEDLSSVVAATPSADTTESPRPRSTNTTVRTRRERQGHSGRESRSSARHRRRRSRSRITGPVIAAVAIVALLAGGALFWVTSGDGEPDDVTKIDPATTVDPVPPPTPPDPGPVDPPPDPDPREVISPRITIGRETERGRLPVWIADVLLPEEAATPPPAFGLESVDVGDAASARYRDLAAAIESTKPNGRAIRLTGPGPFLLDPVEVAGGRHVVIAGDPADRPLVWLRNGERSSRDSLFELRGTSLTLAHVDLVVEEGPQVGAAPAVIGVDGGDLVLRNCSVTVRGDRPRAVFSVTGSVIENAEARGPRVLLDRSVVRGNAIRVLESDAPRLHFATWNALLASGRGPVLELGGAADEFASPGVRHIDLFSSTLYAGRLAFDVDVPSGRPAPSTRFAVHNTIVASREPEATLLTTRGWTIVGEAAPARFALPGLEWVSTAAVYPGWEDTIHAIFEGDERREQGYRGWQQTLEPRIASLQFPARWPNSLVEAVAATGPSAFDPRDGSTARIAADDGGRIGAEIDQLRAPDPERVAQGLIVAERPFVPARLVRTGAVTTTFDLNKDGDLGQFLATANLPDTAHVVATGSGVRRCSPIFVDGKSLRLEFVAAGDEPLVIDVRGAKVEATDLRSGRTAAFLTLRNGSLEIVGGHFRLSSAGIGVPAEWFLHATGGAFAIRDCAIACPASDPTFRSVIEWRKPEGVNARAAGEQGLLADSIIVAGGPLVTGDLRHRSLVVRNSVLASRGSLFDLDASSFDPTLDAVIDVQDSTLAAGETYFELRGSRISATVQGPLRVFVDRSVFGPPVDFGAGPARGPVLFAVSKPMLDQQQIAWRGRDNAFWNGLHAYLVDKDVAQPPMEEFAAWSDRWGDGDLRSLSTPNAIRFAKREPRYEDVGTPAFTKDFDRSDVQSAFALDPSSPAAGWRLDGGPVGARIPTGNDAE